ncbi:MAG TPA: WecB/TagA/CpsF family glycosyltransferase [Spirochaetota bacterium]|nr:WecB/TagA/CpsF family glycosyltransferase [Spirochaetota bacterium]HPN82861.1 WecB/TagA/CpsF family glycosyltransferase [Spirochaetota bacterium]
MSRTYSHLFGFRIFAGSMDELLARIGEMAAQEMAASITFVTANRLIKAHFFKKYAAILNSATLLIPQGRGITWVARRFAEPLTTFFSPADVSMNVLRGAIEHKQTLFFLGSRPDTILQAVTTLRKSFPEMRIVGSYHGHFKPERGEDIVSAIRKSAPSFLFVGMGFPKQENWIIQNQKAMPSTIAISVGNTFDLCAGITTRGPLWLRRRGLEGLSKAFRNPLRMGRFFWIIVLVFTVFWHKIFKKHRRK